MYQIDKINIQLNPYTNLGKSEVLLMESLSFDFTFYALAAQHINATVENYRKRNSAPNEEQFR